jgi:Protein of unknown function, DUF481
MTRRTSVICTVIAVAIVALSSASAWASNKTDVVTLANGDRLTCEIVSLDRGRLQIKTDDAGTIQIEWEKIANVVALRQFDILTSDGRQLLGMLGTTEARSLLVIGAGPPVPLLMADVTNIVPIGTSFWKKLDGSFDAGFSYTRSSGIAQTTLNSSTRFRRPEFMMRLDGSGTITSQSDETKKDSRGALSFSYVRYRGGNWFFSAVGSLESNESLGLVLRSQVAALAGPRLVNTNRAQVQAGAGLVVNDEQSLDGASSQNLEALLAFASSYYAYDYPKTSLDLKVQYYPSLSHWGRQRVQVDTAVKRELWSDFYVAFTLYDSFDSAPPNPDSARNDIGVTASVGWSFGR